MLDLDAVLFEQALFNLLDNAAKYAPAQSTICIKVFRGDNCGHPSDLDEGEGIPPQDVEQIILEILSRAKGRPCRPRYGTWSLDLERLRRSDAWIDSGSRTAGTRSGAVIEIQMPLPEASSPLDTAA